MFQRFEKCVDAVFQLGFGKISRIFQIGFDQQSGYVEIFSEIFAHVALSRGEQSTALNRMNHQGIGMPLFDIAAQLLVTLE